MKGTMNDRIEQLEIAIIELREQLDKMSCAKTCKKNCQSPVDEAQSTGV
tara:strand:+ start:286 stop:432 length:147 start_codon:yes stop_codon:yes gene_type:complete